MARGNLIGSWAYSIGVILAIVLGVLNKDASTAWIPTTLVIIGALVGLLNIADEEATPFLMSSVVLVIVASLGGDYLQTASILSWLVRILQALMMLFVPATIIVAIKNVWGLAKE